MNSTLFVAPTWFWTSLLGLAIAAPILIHLINLFRYRKVKWAAMDFLLKSHRKKQKKILLTQALLIATRILLLLLAVLYFGQIGFWTDNETRFRPGTEHVVIIDDSYSMQQSVIVSQSDDSNEAKRQTCYDNAKSTILEIARRLAEQPGQSIRLVLTSERYVDQTKHVFECDSTIQTQLDQFFAEHKCADTSTSPLTWLGANIEDISDSSPVYLLTDYRLKDFENPEANTIVNNSLNRFQSFNVIACSKRDSPSNNLSIQSLVPENGFVAASVPFFLSLKVENHNAKIAKNTEIRIRIGSISSNGKNTMPRVEVTEEPSVLIPEIEGHSIAEVQIPLLVNQPGQIIVEAFLPNDELNADNKTHRLIEVRNSNQALLIAESDSSSVRYLEWLLEPKSQGSQLVNSGFRTDIVGSTQFGSSVIDIEEYQVVFLLSDDLTNTKMIQEIESYVQNGGLLFWVPGKFADIPSINRQLHKDGKGILPFPLVGSVDLPERAPEVDVDIDFLEEDLKKYFEGESAKLLPLVHIYKKFILPRVWDDPRKSSTVLASVRGRATTPLIVSSNFGQGKVISFLTPFDEEWNNWARNPTFLVLVYQLVFQNLEFDISQDKQVGQILEPESESIYWMQQLGSEFASVSIAAPGNPGPKTSPLSKQGIYSAPERTQPIFTASLDTAESELETMFKDSPPKSKIERSVSNWSDFTFADTNANNSFLILLLLIFLVALIAEQWLGYKLGFHRENRATDVVSSPGARHV